MDTPNTDREPRLRRRILLLVALAVAAVAAIPITVYAVTPGHGPHGSGGHHPAPVVSTSPVGHPVPDGCPKTTLLPDDQAIAIDYIDFVQYFGHQYTRIWGRGHVGRHQLGEVVGQVDCTYAAVDPRHRIDGPTGDGDAAFLPVGTQLHALDGFDPNCRLGVLLDGHVVVYLGEHMVHGTMQPLSCAGGPHA